MTSPGRLRAMTALLLLAPGTPMLFQGQEFAASSPFYYFADHDPELAKLVEAGRAEFLAQFRSLATREMLPCLADPANPSTFERCKLDFSERQRNRRTYDLHKDLLRLRREDPVFRAQTPGGVDGAVLADEAFVLRFFGEAGDDRLLLVNFGADLHLDPAPEPLLAPPEGTAWQTLWSSEDPRYGGCGTPPLDSDENWRIPGHAAVACVQHQRSKKAMTDLIRVLRKREPCDSGIRPPLARRVAGHQRPGRLRLRHRERRHHPPLSRPADRRAAQSARPHDDAERPLRAPAPAGPPRGLHGRRGTRRHLTGGDPCPREFRLEAGLPVWRYEVDGFVLEKRLLLPYRQNTVHITYRLLSGKGTLRLGLRPAMHFRSHDAPVSQRALDVLQTDRVRGPVRDHGRCGPARAAAHRPRSADRLHLRPQGNLLHPLPDRARPRLRIAGVAVEPRLLPRRSGRGRPDDAGGLHRGLGDDPRAGAGRSFRAELDRRKLLLAPLRRTRRRDRPRNWCWPPTSSSSRPPAAWRTPRARAPPATRSAPSSPAITGSPTGAAIP